MSKSTRYTDDMPAKVLELMQNGTLPAELPGKLAVTKDDVLAWLRDGRKTEFRNSFRLGMAASEAYWTRMALEALTSGFGKGFKEKLYLYIMKTQFGWSDKEMEMEKVEREAIMSDEELDAKIEQLIGAQSPLGNVVSISSKISPKKRKAA